ncbi:hypothetical protein JW879_07175 [candidate division WOR-3 bacterium]|nr:hypothetical protein [candidate division WOR-3 bacterium]
MISSVIILGLVGWIIALLLIYRNIKVEEEKNYKAIHSSAIRDGRVGKLFKSGIIEGIPVISEEDMRTISKYLESDEVPEGFKDDLRTLKELNLKVIKKDLSEICKTLSCPAITAGNDKEELEIRGIQCINLKDLDTVGKSNLIRGEKITVNHIDYGYDKAQGYLADGTLVEIEGDVPENQPVTLECIVEAIIENNFSRKVWARVAKL